MENSERPMENESICTPPKAVSTFVWFLLDSGNEKMLKQMIVLK